MTKVFALYNHKGGVSKTTTSFNLAHFLAQSGKRVLVIDADPQCNCTEIMLAQQLAVADALEAETGQSQALPGKTLLDLMRPRIEGTASAIEIDDDIEIRITDNLFLIRGDVDLSSIEDSLSEAHQQRHSAKTHDKRTYGALYDFVQRIGEARGYDYIMFDVGPSSGALTRACLLTCDGFFVPTMPDRFNVQAVGTLATIVSRWISENHEIVKSFEQLGLPVPPGQPRFLGLIISNFKMYKEEPKPSYKYWMDQLPDIVKGILIPALEEIAGKSIISNVLPDNFVVAQIPDFQGLGPIMQENGKAIFQIVAADTKPINKGVPWAGNVWADAQNRIDEFSRKMELLREAVEEGLK